MKINREQQRREWSLLVVATVMTVSVIAISRADGGIVPAPSTGGPRPTVTLGSSSVAEGQMVNVSGSAPDGFSEVRVTLLIDQNGDGEVDTMQTLATLPVEDGSYGADVTIEAAPFGSPSIVGEGKIAVTVVGALDAEYATADLTITEQPPGGIQGTVPVEALGDGEVWAELIDPQTTTVVDRVLVLADGSFDFGTVAGGTYDVVITGELVRPIASITGVSSTPVLASVVSMELLQCGGFADFDSLFGQQGDTISYVNGSPNFAPSSVLQGSWSELTLLEPLVISAPAFGQYIAHTDGSELVVAFEAGVQVVGDPPYGVRFRIEAEDGTTVWEADDLTPDADGVYSADCSIIDTNLDEGTHLLHVFTLLEGGGDSSDLIACFGRSKEILVAANPVDTAMFDGTITWKSARGKYEFEGWIPDWGILEYWFPDEDFSIPYLGNAASGYQAGIYIEGTVDLKGQVEVTQWEAAVDVDILGQDLWDESKNLMPTEDDEDDSELTFTSSFIYGDVDDIQNPALFEIESDPIELFSKYEDWEVYDGYLWTFWGIVSVGASIDFALDVAVDLIAAAKPMAPEISATFLPSVEPALTLSIYVEVLLGLASGGADANVNAGFEWPVTVSLDENNNLEIDPDDPCIGLEVILDVWAKLLAKRWDLASWELFCADDPNNCFCGSLKSVIDSPPGNVPEEMAMPNVATGPGGRRLLVYSELTGPAGSEQLRIKARHWDSGARVWRVADVISPADFAATDPAVAYYGTTGNAVVAYTLNNLNEAGGAPPDAISDVLTQQEIVAVIWNEATMSWSAPIALTADANPDGRPAVAGSGPGFTVAWTRDVGDRDPATQHDWEIAVRHFQIGSGWSTMTTLDTAAEFAALGMPGVDPMNFQVDVDRRGNKIVLAWVADHDADPSTNGNRRLASAISVPAPGMPQFFDWDTLLIDSLHAPDGWEVSGASLPSVVLKMPEEVAHIVYLSRGLDGGGLTDTGIGNNNQLWHARIMPGAVVVDEAILDSAVDPAAYIMAEKPELALDTDGAPILLARVFGSLDAGLNYFRGQTAWMRFDPVQEVWSPTCFLTDGADQQWQQHFAIDQSDGEAVVVSVSRALDGAVSEGLPSQSMPCVQVATLTQGRDPVEARNIQAEADLCVRVEVAEENLHVVTGTQVPIIIILVNKGRLAAGAQRVQVFAGMDDSGPMLGEFDLVDPLPACGTITTQFEVTREAGAQYITVKAFEVNQQGEEPCPLNNMFTLDIGRLLRPIDVSASMSTRSPKTVLVTCEPPNQQAIGGFRWLRSPSPEGPFENVGETVAPVFYDRLLEEEGIYYYLVQVYGNDGVFSESSAPAVVEVPSIGMSQASGQTGTWASPAVWDEGAVPVRGDNVDIDALGEYTITLADDAVAGGVTLGLPAPFSMPTLDLQEHTLSLTKPFVVASSGRLRLGGGQLDVNRAWVDSAGEIEVTGVGSAIVGDFRSTGSLTVRGSSLSDETTLTLTHALCNNENIAEWGLSNAFTRIEVEEMTLTEDATFTFAAGEGTLHSLIGVMISYGTIEVEGNTLFGGTGSDAFENFGTVNSAAQLSLNFEELQTSFNWGTINVLPGGTVRVENQGQFSNLGLLNISAGGTFEMLGGSLTQQAGETRLAEGGVMLVDATDFYVWNSSLLKGAGTIHGTVRCSGAIEVDSIVDDAPATLTILGSLVVEDSAAELRYDIAGPIAGAGYDQLLVAPEVPVPNSGTVELDGKLVVNVAGEYLPPHDSAFDVLLADSITGTFSEVEFVGMPDGLTAAVEYSADRVTIRFSECAQVIFGDLNCDLVVNINDYDAWRTCFAGPDQPVTAACEATDLNKDGRTDMVDFALLVNAFGG
jgi:hypothetical protein